MNVYKTLNLKPIKTDPDVWIKRLVIFEQITPEPKIIRDIQLSRGLNIVWAEETDDDIPSAEITGHSAGKTTFCRLLRYILGEKTYGTRVNMELIQNAFPNGYVSAEMNVKTRKWAVLRPIGNGRYSYIKEDSSIEELLQDRSRRAYLETYAIEIGLEKLLDRLETGGIVRTGETIRWEHILAWCTRDQEARFQNIYGWRSPRSDSDPPSFRFPKAGPLFLMRVALGLFMPDELKGEEDIAKLQQDQERLEKELEKLKQEPQFRINLYDSELRKCLSSILPGESNIETLPFHSGNLLPDLDRLSKKAVENIESEISEFDRSRKSLQENIDVLGAKIRQYEDQIRTFDGLLNMGEAAGKALEEGINKRQKQNETYTELSKIECKPGGILYGDCQHVRARHKALQFTQYQDAKAMKEAEAKRAEEQERFEHQRQQMLNDIGTLTNERQVLRLMSDNLLSTISEKREKLHDSKTAHEGLEIWTSKKDQAGDSKEIDECKQKLDATSKHVDDLEKYLLNLLAQHNESRDLLASIFSGAVRSVLSSGTYDGRVSLDNRELGFTITHGSAMSGEAVETLSVLLADIASLIYSTVADNAHLPGFLLHDSPREADLGSRIYRNFIRLVASLQEHFGEVDDCPFQYFLTTTTAPPPELQNDRFVKLKLNAAEVSGLLLMRNISHSIDEKYVPRLFLKGEA